VESHLKKLAREGRVREDVQPDRPSRWQLLRPRQNLSGRSGGTVVGEPRRKIRDPLSLRVCLGHLESA
jgi:hypothetical protein